MTLVYPTDKPCDVCGEVDNNGIEPRFLYVVCEKHKHTPPVDIWKKHDAKEASRQTTL